MLTSLRNIITAIISLALLCACAQTTSVSRVDEPALSQQHAKLRKQQVADVSYQLSLTLSKDSPRFSGDVTIDFSLTANNQAPLTVDFESGQLERVEINGAVIALNYRHNFLTFPANHLKPGHNQIRIKYNRPYDTDGYGFHRSIDANSGQTYIYSDFQAHNANRLLPSFDQPDLKASFTLDVKAPKDWQLISTTRETQILTLGDSKHWFFKPSAKISSYVFSLHAGPYQMWQNNQGKVPMRLFARQPKAHLVDPDFWFTTARKTMTFFEQYFAIDYPFEKYDQVIIPDYDAAAAMENVAAVTYAEAEYLIENPMSKKLKTDLADTIAHEMAHMWFGNLVTLQWWNGLWLNESIASYMAVLAMEKALKMDDAWNTYNTYFKDLAYKADQLVTTHPIELPIKDTDMADAIFDDITYGKGAAVVAQLTRYLGEDDFQQGIRNYLKRYSYGNTTLADFFAELATASGKDLTPWTDQWLYHAGVNTLSSEIICKDDEIVQATIYQKPDQDKGILRQHSVKLGLYQMQGDELGFYQAFEVTVKGEKTTVDEVIGDMCPDFSYPNHDDWGYVKVEFPPESLSFLNTQLGMIQDGQLRRLIWQDLWDMVNQKQLSIAQFITMAEQHLTEENNPDILAKVNGYLGNAFAWLSKAETKNAALLRLRIETLAWLQLLQNTVRGNQNTSTIKTIGLDDIQWFLSVAHSNVGLQKIQSLLNDQLLGFTLDSDPQLQWQLIYALNRYNFEQYQTLTDQAIAQDSATESKPISSRSFAPDIAKLIRPLAAEKDHWLTLMTQQPSQLKLEQIQQLMLYSFTPEQSQLYDNYQQSLLNALPLLAKNTSFSYQMLYTKLLLKGNCSAASVERLTQAITRHTELSLYIQQALREALQQDQHCVEMIQSI